MPSKRDAGMALPGYRRLPDEPDQPERYVRTRHVNGEEVSLMVARSIPLSPWFGVAEVGHVTVARTEPQESAADAAKALRRRLDKAAE